MADGLLLTEKERLRLFWLKFGAGVGQALAVAVVALAVVRHASDRVAS